MANYREACFLLPLIVLLTLLANAHLGNCVSFRQEQDRVSKLPGQDFNVGFAHYAGYVTVNQEFGRALFYWFFEADEDPDSKPLLLWLNGGPGCSSIGYGEAAEIGPFRIKPDGKTLYLNPYSWNKIANVLFLDMPVGAGFSYSNTSSDVFTNGDKRTAEDSLKFLQSWFERFPQYKEREFYIVGESYGGHYVPQLSQAIVRYNQASRQKTINIKGYMVGNGLTDDFSDRKGVFQYIWSLGFISDETYSLLTITCSNVSFVHPTEACAKALETADAEMGNIDQYSVFTPTCTANTSHSQPKWLLRKTRRIGLISEEYDPCIDKHTVVYFNRPEVQNALHVQRELAPSKWEICSDTLFENWQDSSHSVLDIYHELIAAGLRIWIFSGDADAVVPVTATRYSIGALGLRPLTSWKPWNLDGQVGGWTQQYEGLNFVTVRGAGHEVPLHKPKEALELFKAFVSGNPLPTSETNITPQLISAE